MPEPKDIHRVSTRFLSSAMLILGIAMIISTVVRGGGVFAIGLVMGILFILAGAGRLYVSFKT